MAIKHAVVKVPGQTLAAVADWNANHTIDPNTITAAQTQFADQNLKIASSPTFSALTITNNILVGGNVDGVDISAFKTTYDAHDHSAADPTQVDHAELTNVTPDQHHAQLHNAVSHTDIASTGAQIDDAVSKKHTQGTDTTLGAMTAVINMNTHQINNVVDPTLDQDAATKKYIDDLIPAVGTEYVSIPGVAFQENYGGDAWGRNDLDGDFRVEAVAGDWWCWAAIQIPHGAVVTGAKVYGADATNTWYLQRKTLTGGVAAMATAAVNTEDVTIANATIDNSLYSYQFWVWIGANDQIYGARVTYTI